MIVSESPKSESDVMTTQNNPSERGGDLPPAYDALSIRQPNQVENAYGSFSAFPAGPVAGSSRGRDTTDPGPALARPRPQTVFNTNKSLPAHPSPVEWPGTFSTLKDTQSLPPTPNSSPHARKSFSWLSLVPFASSFSTKRVRQSTLSIVSDLVLSPSRVSIKDQRNVHEILASLAETCAEHKLVLSALLQEAFITGHTPMYWAVVNYREELLVALLFYARPLSAQAISDIRCACLVSSNQGLFHALRVCRSPYHTTDGIQIPGLRTASENLLVENRPLDEVRIQRSNDQGFVVSFDITHWQNRMRAIGYSSVQFIVCGRMWSVTFFSTEPSSPMGPTVAKSKKRKSSWYIMINLLESSPPTFFGSQLVIDVTSPSTPEPIQQAPRLRDTRSMTLPSARNKHISLSSSHDSNYDEIARERSSRSPNALTRSEGSSSPSSFLPPPPPTHPLRGSSSSSRLSMAGPPPISVRLQAGKRKLGRRIKSGEPPKLVETLTTRPDTWSDHGVGYANAVVSPLEESQASLLLCEHSRYLLSDGTLRARLEARLVKPESSKDCVIC